MRYRLVGSGGGAEALGVQEPDRGDQGRVLVRAQRPASEEIVQGIRVASGVYLVGGAGLPFVGFVDEVVEEGGGCFVFEEGAVLLVAVGVLGRDLVGGGRVDQRQPERVTQLVVEAEGVGASAGVGEVDDRRAGLDGLVARWTDRAVAVG